MSSTATSDSYNVAKIVLFPPPPPTTNALSAAQRTRLMRSTQKLGRILGATPHFVDTGPEEERRYYGSRGIFNDMSPSPSSTLRSSSRASIDSRRSDSLSSCTSTESASSSFTTSTSSSSLLTRSSSSSSLRSRKPLPQHDTWPTRKPPMLRLALSSSPTLEPIPASPLTPQTITTTTPRPTHHRGTPPLDGSSSPLTTLSPVEPIPKPHDSDLEPSPTAPTFTIPHPAAPAARRAKMDRLRRTLGEGVPVRLVFPPSPSPSPYSSDGESEPPPSLSLSSSSCPSTYESGVSRSSGSEEEALDTPDTSSPVSAERGKDLPPMPVQANLTHIRTSFRSSGKRGIKYTRDSLAHDDDDDGKEGPAPSSPHRRAARKGTGRRGEGGHLQVVVPVASRPAPPPPPPPPVAVKPKSQSQSQLQLQSRLKAKKKQEGVRTGLGVLKNHPAPVPAYVDLYASETETLDAAAAPEPPIRMTSSVQLGAYGNERMHLNLNLNPHPQVHRRSSTSASSSSSSCSSASSPRSTTSKQLDVILESPFELESKDSHSKWFGSSDDDDDNDDDDDERREGEGDGFEVLSEEEVLEAAMSSLGPGCQWGWRCVHTQYGTGEEKGKGKGRGLARSYGRVRAVAVAGV